MVLRCEDGVVAPGVASNLVLRQLGVVYRHCVQKTVRIDKRQKSYTLPCHPFAIHVNVE